MQPSKGSRSRRLTRRAWIRAAAGLAAGAALTPVLSACGRSGSSRAFPAARPATAPRDPSGKPVRGGTLTVRSFADASVLDYAFKHDVYSGFVIGNCVESLVTHDAQALLVGLLAASWENPDNRTYVLKLQQGVSFQDGSELSADAVEYSMNRVRNDKAAFRHQDLLPIDKIEKPDKATVRITLGAPFAPFLEKLAADAGRVISPTRAAKYGRDRLKLDLSGQGTGPFRFLDWRTDDHLTLVRNENYWDSDGAAGALPYLNKVVVRPIADENVAFAALRNGELDAFRK